MRRKRRREKNYATMVIELSEILGVTEVEDLISERG
jgi:hypothetical protein